MKLANNTVKQILDMSLDRERLLAACKALGDLYCANNHPKTGPTFISCITHKHASEMTRAQRRKCAAWSAWDEARNAIRQADYRP